MNQSEFNILVTNVSAVAMQTFTVKFEDFTAAMSAERNSEAAPKSIDLDTQLERIDFQAILDSGYQSLTSLEAELNDAWNSHDSSKLDHLLKQIPAGLPAITQQLSAQQLREWIKHNLTSEDAQDFHELHQYVMSLFKTFNDDTYDLIREAIAFDTLDELRKHEQNVKPEHIKFEDLMTAASIDSFKAFEWLLKRMQLTDDQTIELLETLYNDASTFERIYHILLPSEAIHRALIDRARSNSNQTAVDFLNRLKG